MSKALVLCVDDDIASVEIRELLLQHKGYDTIAAYDGATAVRALANNANIDLVILDYTLPDSNGGEVGQLMRAIKPNLPIVMLSGLTTRPADVDGAIDAFLTKGRRTEELLDQMEYMLSRNIEKRA